ncbi:uncharacterized protein BP5553_10137 [Venustampulla echinocandica]|uniref:Alpha/beta hydrolase fold-3 domain-containing protein n=1 Tax=Venustampulla echinocandica TaxID=2656787 RepID=A0A370TAH1_9HELO|nr:uncharacterized protein BP5553_10137 [Venustampulla echinocandica]RDL30792.1 hypothetical protein BP5553_10137 [Venustampulla echinocandica]
MSYSTTIPFAPELLGPLKAVAGPPGQPPILKEGIQDRRDLTEPFSAPENVFKDPHLVHEDTTIPGPDGNTIEVTIVKKKDQAPGLRPGIFYLHGGGLILGKRTFLLQSTFPWIKELDTVLITPEYRLAPENQHPAMVEDCYAALKWVVENTSKLGIDPNKLMIAGHSAGGGLAAGTTLLARDRKLPVKLCAQLLCYPMLDDRRITVSSRQFDDVGTWKGNLNDLAWSCVLDGKKDREDVIYAAPARATDLSGLPTTWIDVGAAEPFRDEDVAYATKLWECGVQTELHVWAGAFHGYDLFAPESEVAAAGHAARMSWLKRVLDYSPPVTVTVTAAL